MRNNRLEDIFNNECLPLCDSKNGDYAHPEDFYANFRAVEQGGVDTWAGVYVRLCDKISRLHGFVRRYNKTGNITANHEGIEDTLLDMANYTVITLDTYRQWRAMQNGTNSGVKKEPAGKDRGEDRYDSGIIEITNTAPSLEEIYEEEQARDKEAGC